MIKHYFKSAIRNILRQKLFSAINIIGLSISLTASFLILLYVIHEFSYDKSHKNRDKIYRIVKSIERNKEIINSVETTRILGPDLEEKFPEIEYQTRIVNYSRMYYDGISIHQEKGETSVTDFFMVDNSFFNIFTIPLLSGSTDLLYSNLNAIFISKSIALKHFGHLNAVGQMLEFTHQGGSTKFTIAGVYKDLKQSSSIQANIIGNINYVESKFKDLDKYPWAETYLMTIKDIDLISFNNKFNKFMYEVNPKDKSKYNLQALGDIYFHSRHIESNYRVLHGDLKNIYIFTIIAIAILLIASINYILMSTANAINRAIEIGIRKTLGASRRQLFGQVVVESLSLSLVALFTALVLTEIFLPVANQIFDKELLINYSENWQFIAGMTFITLFVTLISGVYTSIYLSKFEAIKVLKKQLIQFNNKAIFRKFLIVFQLVIFIILIICTSIISKQINFAQNKDMGFNRKNLINVLTIVGDRFQQRNEIFLSEIKTSPYIVSASGTYGGLSFHELPRESVSTLSRPEEIQIIERMSIWEDFFETMEIQLIAGANFTKGSDNRSLILNETAAKKLGLKNPLEETLVINKISYNIIGIVKDFNVESVHSTIPALIIDNDKTISNIFVRVNEINTQKVINFIEKKWDETYKDYGGRFHYYIIDQNFRNSYQNELKFGKMIQTFATLSIFIAFLGLFGLSAFLAKQKTKEIGIRKVYGAPIYLIIKNVSKDFLILTIIANIIAWPISWYLMDLWLQNFAYKINMPFEIFLITGLATVIFVIAILTLNAYKAATANPIDSIKYE